MLKRTLLTVFVFALLVVWAPTFVEADTSISAPFVTVGVGDTFKIPILITDATDLASFEFDLSFESLIVQANVAGATAGALLPSDWFFTSPGFVDNTSGQILDISAFGSVVSGSGVLADIEFLALSPGVSQLIFSHVFLNLLDSGFTILDGQVTVTGTTPVPEPGTLMLLACGLTALCMRRLVRRGRRNDF
jgi:hypothetical protein